VAAFKDNDLGWKAIKAQIDALKKLEVVVGVLENAGENGDGSSIAEYATDNEYGTDRIPSRPFMRTAFDENAGQIGRDMAAQGKAVSTGKRDARDALTIIGQKQADRIKNTITGRDFLPRLSPLTVAAKRGSEKTLVDTGAMVNAIHPAVRARRP